MAVTKHVVLGNQGRHLLQFERFTILPSSFFVFATHSRFSGQFLEDPNHLLGGWCFSERCFLKTSSTDLQVRISTSSMWLTCSKRHYFVVYRSSPALLYQGVLRHKRQEFLVTGLPQGNIHRQNEELIDIVVQQIFVPTFAITIFVVVSLFGIQFQFNPLPGPLWILSQVRCSELLKCAAWFACGPWMGNTRLSWRNIWFWRFRARYTW